ncbi:hypothetical protein FRUB_00374 [Fimbriiglobus ruber]|uniref:Glycosyltransferase RgtA/B/C/D-like domain-containing protein n=1 Tax=Fimbriiglobus ruber TaxID=1908690 RepID=A0A225EE59_9BACT|nr:hypothetical protein FRUB_00374 [Fimbriiglobus ruber]
MMACGVFGLVLFRPVRDVDMFWQVRTGELMLDTGRLVTADPFTSTHPDEPVPTIYWLSQLLYAGLLKVGSWELLHRLDALLFALALWVVAVSARYAGGGPLPGAAALGVAVLVALPHHGLRPQTFGMLGFALLVALHQSSLCPWRKAVATLGLVTVWQNLHPSGTTAVLYLGALLVGDGLRSFTTRTTNGTRLLQRTAAVVAAAVGCLLTPDGIGIVGLSARNAATAKALGVEEWLPMWDAATWPACQMTWLAIIGTAALLWKVRGRARWEEVAVCATFTLATLFVYRMSLQWALAMVPIWARWIDVVYPGPVPNPDTRLDRRLSYALVALGVATAAVVPLFVRPPVFDPSIPFAGLDRVREMRVRGPVYNYREWGGPLIWACQPDVKVTIDGRLYLFPQDDWDEYLRAAMGQIPLEEIEKRYSPVAFFLRPSYDAALIPLIRDSGRWTEAYADDNCILFVRSSRTLATP